jgi:hypothetical protein
MHDAYAKEVTQKINGHYFNFDDIAEKYFMPDCTDVAQGELGGIDSVRALLEQIAATVKEYGAVMTPTMTTYPVIYPLGETVVNVLATGSTRIEYPDGRNSAIRVTSTNLLVKPKHNWLFQHLHRTWTVFEL